jgi:hypothetical protein
MGDTWRTNMIQKPNTPIAISEGWCDNPERGKRPKWSHCHACNHFDPAPRTGLIICGEGAMTHEVMADVMRQTHQFIEEQEEIRRRN